MTKSNDYIFVLWGAGFDEAAAAIFITELRKAGLLVKVVGLHSGQISGANGLALLPDLTLGKALTLAVRVICVVIPYGSPDSNQLRIDPRLGKFFAQTQANKAKFVVKQSDETTIAGLDLFPKNGVINYPEDESLVEFVRELARSLARPGQ